LPRCVFRGERIRRKWKHRIETARQAIDPIRDHFEVVTVARLQQLLACRVKAFEGLNISRWVYVLWKFFQEPVQNRCGLQPDVDENPFATLKRRHCLPRDVCTADSFSQHAYLI
jgi:hypothetical protein